MEFKQKEVTRPLSSFHPSIWGDQFLVYDDQEEDQVAVTQTIERLKEEVRKGLVGAMDDVTTHTNDLLKLINDIQRLGIGYCFEREIEQALHHIHTMYGHNSINDASVSLWFRLLRQQGFYISCDIFNKYQDKKGSFDDSALASNVEAILELYEATYMRVRGEVVLDDAHAFAKHQLQQITKDPLIWNCTPYLSNHIQEALERPIWKRLPRLDTLRYIPFYEQQVSHNESLLKLAKLDFNRLQSLHKKELSQLSRWWKSFDPSKNLHFVRDRLVELYFWILGVYFEPQYSRSRFFLTKVLTMATILDDTYDSFGTYEELEIFTEAVQRWSVTCMDTLPDYMKLIYKIIIDCFDEIEEVMATEGKAYQVNYAKEMVKEMGKYYMIEAKWRKDGYIPATKEHESVTFITSGYKMLTTSSFISMGDMVTQESFQWALSNPPLVKAACAISRLMDDIVGHKAEQQRSHVVSSVECYMKEHNATVEDAYDFFNQRIEDAWKDMNLELVTCKDIPMPLKMRVINLARVMELLYKYDDTLKNVGEELKNNIKSCLINPMRV